VYFNRRALGAYLCIYTRIGNDLLSPPRDTQLYRIEGLHPPGNPRQLPCYGIW